MSYVKHLEENFLSETRHIIKSMVASQGEKMFAFCSLVHKFDSCKCVKLTLNSATLQSNNELLFAVSTKSHVKALHNLRGKQLTPSKVARRASGQEKVPSRGKHTGGWSHLLGALG